MADVGIFDFVIAIVVTFGAAVIAGTVGIGFGIISVPILSLVNPALAPVPQLIVALPLTAAMVGRERGDIDLSLVGSIVVGKIPGAILGVALLATATSRTLDLIVGVAVLVGVAGLSSGWKPRESSAIDLVAGFVSGVTGVVAAIGGPPLAFALSRRSGPQLRSTLSLVAVGGVIISLTARVLGAQIQEIDLIVGAVIFLPTVAGFLVSTRVLPAVEGTPTRLLILTLSSLAALGLILRSTLE